MCVLLDLWAVHYLWPGGLGHDSCGYEDEDKMMESNTRYLLSITNYIVQHEKSPNIFSLV